MLSDEQTKLIEPKINTMKIIVGAMAMGVLTCTLLFFFMREPPKFSTEFSPITTGAIGFAALMFCIAFVAPAVIRKQQAKQLSNPKPSADSLISQAVQLYQTTLIIRCGLIEGPTFVCIIVYFVSGNLGCLITALIGIALIAFQLPTKNSVISSIEWMLDLAKDEGNFGV